MLADKSTFFQTKHPLIFSKISPFALFCLIIGLITSADTLMSYLTPVYIESIVQNEFSMGLTLISALFFPLSLQYLPPIIPVLFLSTAIWGIYYEALSFTNFDFIKHHFPLVKHEYAWGTINMIKSIALTICPALASILLTQGYGAIFKIVISIIIIASLLGLIYKEKYGKPDYRSINDRAEVFERISMINQLKIWLILLKKVWPLFLFVVMMYLVDSTFWSVGIILAEDLKNISEIGGLMMTAYSLPSIVLSWLAVRTAKPFGKKRIAFILGILSGLALIGVSLVKTPSLIVGGVFIFSSFFAIIWPEIDATFENYIVGWLSG